MTAAIREVRVFEILIGTVLSASVAIQAWIVITIIEHGNQLSAINANRHTSEDARTVAAATASELLSLWREIAKVREDMALNVNSSEEVLRWLERLERDVREHQHAQGAIR